MRKHGGFVVSHLLALGLLVSTSLAQQDWYVDVNAPGCATGTGTQLDPFCAIQTAIDAAADGDTVHIAPGTYFENVLVDKDLALIGIGGRDVTILDGMASGSVVRVRDTGATLSGLTMTNGSGTTYGPYSFDYGGGLFIYAPAQPGLPVVLTRCSVTENRAQYVGHGGGVANGTRLVSGASLTLRTTPVAENLSDSNGGLGGGIFTGSGSTTTISESVVMQNTSGSGGGIFAEGPLFVAKSMVLQNQARGFFGKGGGGIYSDSRNTETTVVDSTIGGNWAYGSGGIGGVSDLTLLNSSVVQNWAVRQSPGIGSYGQSTLVNTTVAGNSSLYPHSAVYVNGGDLAAVNSILWGDGAVAVLVGPGSTVDVTWSLVKGGWPGTGNIDENPGFAGPRKATDWYWPAPNWSLVKGDYRLRKRSPCIDAGDNTAVPPGITQDLRGAPRFVDDPDRPDTGIGPAPVIDMGAYEYFFEAFHPQTVPGRPPLRPTSR